MFEENSKSKWFYYLSCPILFISSFLWLMITQVFADEWFLIRNIGVLCLLLTFSLYFVPRGKYRKQAILIGCLIFGATRLSPLEISLRNYPGPPHLVPLVAGFPTEKYAEMARKQEAMLNGCMVSGYEPEWVLVW